MILYHGSQQIVEVPRRVEKDVQKYGRPFVSTDGKDEPWAVCCEESALRASATLWLRQLLFHEEKGHKNVRNKEVLFL